MSAFAGVKQTLGQSAGNDAHDPYRTSGERLPLMSLAAAGLLSRDTARHLQQSRTKPRLSVYVTRYLLDEFHQIL